MDVEQGPSISALSQVEAEAYDVISAEIPKDGNNIDVDLMPSTSGQLRFLLIQSDSYGADLTFKVDTKTITLDGLQLITGKGARDLLGKESIDKLTFKHKNVAGQPPPAKVEILVGRKATP